MPQVFKDFDLSSVWEANSWADKNYKEAPFTPEILAAVESELGYKLPQRDLCKIPQNPLNSHQDI